MGETDEVLLEDLPVDFRFSASSKIHPKVRRFYDAIDDTTREVCINALTASKGNCVAAAQMLGLHRNSVYRIIRRHGLNHLLEPEGTRKEAASC